MRLHKLAKRLTAALVSSAMAFSLCAPALALSGSGPSEYDDIALTAEFFPDAAFRAYLAEEVDEDGDSILSDWERRRTTSMFCVSEGIASLEGIQYFTALEDLVCFDNQLTELDVSGCPHLVTLNCDGNQLTELDVSGNPRLESLDCSGNPLTRLTLGSQENLAELYCCADRLTGLDLSGCPQLEELAVADTPLTSLDVSVCPNLTVLECQRAQLTALDVSANKSLQRLCCYNNQLTELDVSQNPELSNLQCDSNQLTRLDVGANPKLSYLTCSKNQLTELDVSQNLKLNYLGCTDNQLTELDVSLQPDLGQLLVSGNPITELDLSQNPELYLLWCENTLLTHLDLTANPDVRNLHFSGSPLLRLDLAPGTQLREPETLVSEITLTENKLEDGRYDLHDLPGFEPDRYQDWTGGTVDENGILTVAEGNTDHKVSCTYRCGSDVGTLTVVLNLHLHALQWQHDETSHWQTCAADGFATEKTAHTWEDWAFDDLYHWPSCPVDGVAGEKTLHTFDEEHGTHCTECPYDQSVAVPGGPADDGFGLYELTTRVMLKKLLPAGAAIPKTQGELALLLWQTAGCPATVTPPPADTEDAKAAQWCTEQGLFETVEAGKRVSKARVIRTWQQAFPQN